MTEREELVERISNIIRSQVNVTDEMLGVIIIEVFDAVADIIDELEIPIDSEHWLKTKRYLSAETGRATARWFRGENS